MSGYGSPKSGKRTSLIIALGVFVLALVVYFLFFTGSSDQSTRIDMRLEPSTASETPEPGPSAAPAN